MLSRPRRILKITTRYRNSSLFTDALFETTLNGNILCKGDQIEIQKCKTGFHLHFEINLIVVSHEYFDLQCHKVKNAVLFCKVQDYSSQTLEKMLAPSVEENCR